MNVLHEVETSWVIDHLHVLGTVRHFGEQKKKERKKEGGTALPHCQKDGGGGKAIEVLIRDRLSLFPSPVQL